MGDTLIERLKRQFYSFRIFMDNDELNVITQVNTDSYNDIKDFLDKNVGSRNYKINSVVVWPIKNATEFNYKICIKLL